MLTLISDDELLYIISYLEFKDMVSISGVSGRLNIFYKSQRNIRMWALKFNMKNPTLDQLKSRYHIDIIMPIITLLAHFYQAQQGFQTDLITFNNDKCVDVAVKYGKIYRQSQKYEIVTESKRISDKSQIKFRERLLIRFDISYLQKLSQIIIYFKSVIIKYRDRDFETSNPEECYNDLDNKFLSLPCLKSRPYIIINEPFMQITISSEIKRSVLVIEDVLIAWRLLFDNKTRRLSYDGNFTLLGTDNYDILSIKPDIYGDMPKLEPAL